MTSSTAGHPPDTERVAVERALRPTAERHFQSSSLPLVHDVQGEELKIVVVVEPAQTIQNHDEIAATQMDS